MVRVEFTRTPNGNRIMESSSNIMMPTTGYRKTSVLCKNGSAVSGVPMQETSRDTSGEGGGEGRGQVWRGSPVMRTLNATCRNQYTLLAPFVRSINNTVRRPGSAVVNLANYYLLGPEFKSYHPRDFFRIKAARLMTSGLYTS